MKFIFLSIILAICCSCNTDTSNYTNEEIKELNREIFKKQELEAIRYKSKCDSLLRVSKQSFQNDTINSRKEYHKILKVDSTTNTLLFFLNDLKKSVMVVDDVGELMVKEGNAKKYWVLANRNRETLIEILDSSEARQLGIKTTDEGRDAYGEAFTNLFKKASLDMIVSFINNNQIETLRQKRKAFEIILNK